MLRFHSVIKGQKGKRPIEVLEAVEAILLTCGLPSVQIGIYIFERIKTLAYIFMWH